MITNIFIPIYIDTSGYAALHSLKLGNLETYIINNEQKVDFSQAVLYLLLLDILLAEQITQIKMQTYSAQGTSASKRTK